jgi:acetate kinase
VHGGFQRVGRGHVHAYHDGTVRGSVSGSILALNAGSSSLKFALFRGDEASCRGEIEDLNGAPHLRARDAQGRVLAERRWEDGAENAFGAALQALLAFAESHLGEGGLAAVGHRVVHGGAHHVAPERVTGETLALLEELVPLDPLHMPHCLAPIRELAHVHPGLQQVACFDTAFHHTLPAVARRFGLPRALEAEGIQRYGFHGLSYEYIAGALARQHGGTAPRRVVVAHLGSGASLCALRDGVSIATTMGFSTLDGLVMATRCGTLDPGVLLYLGRQGKSFSDIEDMLYHRSGLLGVSGISGDIRVLLKSEAPEAAAAVELFCYRIACEAGALVSALGGLDGLVFTGGIGEHAAEIRRAVGARLAWLGLEIDEAANAGHARLISAHGSSILAHVITTDEEAMIAQHTRTAIRMAG